MSLDGRHNSVHSISFGSAASLFLRLHGSLWGLGKSLGEGELLSERASHMMFWCTVGSFGTGGVQIYDRVTDFAAAEVSWSQ